MHLPWLLSAFLIGATSPAPPPEPTGAALALYEDLRKLIDAQMRRNWFIDRLELNEGANQALRSVCQTPTEQRRDLAKWLAAGIEAEGGPPRAQFDRGRSLEDLDEALRLDRVRMQLEHAEATAAQDCPFWLPARADFAGVQGDAGRFVLLLETMGGGQLYITREPIEFGGAGGLRILPAYGITQHLTLAAGVEVGGASTLPKDRDGQRNLDLGFALATPVMVRWQRFTRFVDVEAAFTRRADEFDLGVGRNGVRVIAGLGLSEVRLASFMPYAGLWTGYELLPETSGGRKTEHVLRIGTKVGVDWDVTQ